VNYEFTSVEQIAKLLKQARAAEKATKQFVKTQIVIHGKIIVNSLYHHNGQVKVSYVIGHDLYTVYTQDFYYSDF